jgi:chromosome segregation ATPase
LDTLFEEERWTLESTVRDAPGNEQNSRDNEDDLNRMEAFLGAVSDRFHHCLVETEALKEHRQALEQQIADMMTEIRRLANVWRLANMGGVVGAGDSRLATTTGRQAGTFYLI